MGTSLLVRRASLAMLATLASAGLANAACAREGGPDSDSVRRAAAAAGLRPLGEVKLPEVANLGEFVRPGPHAARALLRLGKAFFWDMQVGSDGQACASCHFHAGADVRAKNQLSPGLRHTVPELRTVFAPTGSGGPGGPNAELVAGDFPFHRLVDPEDRHSAVEFDSDDVASSQGVFRADFVAVVPGRARDEGAPAADPTFQVGGANVRRVESRHTPTVINAVFNFANFWDGRAHNLFNGASALGPLDPDAGVFVLRDGRLTRERVRIPNSSLASQAVAPPVSDLEMSFLGRSFREVGRKLLGARPLAGQLVHPKDGVLGQLSRAELERRGRVVGEPGLATMYAKLVEEAFRPEYWSSSERVDGYSQMELNTGLFFGLAVQAYERTLVSDRTPFDRFMAGDDRALGAEALLGLVTFVGRGNCVSCHAGAELTNASVGASAAPNGEPRLIAADPTPELEGPELVVGEETAFRDVGFANIGVRRTDEDLGRGGIENGFPLAFARQALAGLDFAPELPACGGADEPACPRENRVAVDGAMKVPGLRNVELTGPYFHNGGQATLEQVVEFYDRQGDASDENLAELDRQMALVDLEDEDEEPLVEFLLSFTDERVREERAPFDHPQLFVPNGHPGDAAAVTCRNGLEACDELLEVPPIGRRGRLAAGLDPLGTFLDLEPVE